MKKAPTSRKRPKDAHTQQAEFARRVLRAEADAVAAVKIDETFHRAVESILACRGAVVVSGLGKSGLIGQKLSATFASTGTPSHFLHPAEALHGDLGRVRRDDVVLLLSFSGSTEETVTLATILKQDGVLVIAIVGVPDCDLARLATIAMCIGHIDQACPMNLAPTASTTAMLALGDALALCVSRRRNFGVEDFKRVHPGGAIGRQLTPVVEVMRYKAGVNMPLVPRKFTVEKAYRLAQDFAPAIRRAGALVVVNKNNSLAGIFTDGDLRRLVFTRGSDVLREPIEKVMTAHPRKLLDSALVRDAVQMIREHRIDELPVVRRQGEVVGLIDVQDLLALKVIEG